MKDYLLFLGKITKNCNSDELKIKTAQEAVLFYKGINENVKILKTKNGAPYIKGHKDIFMSVSHKNNQFVSVFSKKRIGVDIEVYDEDVYDRLKKIDTENLADKCNINNDFAIKELNKKINIIKRFFSNDEKDAFYYYMSKNKHNKLRMYKKFYELWTKKEALIKYERKNKFKTMSDSNVLEQNYNFIKINRKNFIGHILIGWQYYDPINNWFGYFFF